MTHDSCKKSVSRTDSDDDYGLDREAEKEKAQGIVCLCSLMVG